MKSNICHSQYIQETFHALKKDIKYKKYLVNVFHQLIKNKPFCLSVLPNVSFCKKIQIILSFFLNEPCTISILWQFISLPGCFITCVQVFQNVSVYDYLLCTRITFLSQCLSKVSLFCFSGFPMKMLFFSIVLKTALCFERQHSVANWFYINFSFHLNWVPFKTYLQRFHLLEKVKNQEQNYENGNVAGH